MSPAFRWCPLRLPIAIAGWLRYLPGVDDEGNHFELAADRNGCQDKCSVKKD